MPSKTPSRTLSEKHQKPSEHSYSGSNPRSIGPESIGEAEDYWEHCHGDQEGQDILFRDPSLDEELEGIIDIESLKGIRARRL